MKISENRFEELVSHYLDGKATEAQLKTMVEAMIEYPQLANKFSQLRNVHIATCKYFGKKPRLVNLKRFIPDSYLQKKRNTKTAVFEWSRVAALVAITFGIATTSHKIDYNSDCKSDTLAKTSYEIKNLDIKLAHDNYFSGEDFSIIEVFPTAKKYPLVK